MTYSFAITYLPCQQCSAKIHCDECDARLNEALAETEGITHAAVKISAGKADIQCALDADTVEELLDDLGVFIS